MNRGTNGDWGKRCLALQQDVENPDISVHIHELRLVQTQTVVEGREPSPIDRHRVGRWLHCDRHSEMLARAHRHSTPAFLRAPFGFHSMIPDDAVLLRPDTQVECHRVGIEGVLDVDHESVGGI